MVRDDYCERNKNSTERERDQKESVLIKEKESAKRNGRRREKAPIITGKRFLKITHIPE